MPFAQLVIGPPGSGKTTYCNGMQQFLNQLGRKTIVVNLDPANDTLDSGELYKPAIDIRELISLEKTMQEMKLGPNGALIFCMEYLERNIDWLIDELCKFFPALKEKDEGKGDYYVIFDCPGQMEIYTHHKCLKNIVSALEALDFRFCAVHLVDSHYCTDPAKYISVLLLTLSTMVALELPHVNVLSKIDLIEQFGELQFDLDFYTEVQDLNHLVSIINPADSEEEDEENEEKPKKKSKKDYKKKLDLKSSKTKVFFDERFHKLNQVLSEVIEDYSMVEFHTLCIEDKDSLMNLLRVIDKCNGYAFGALELENESIFETAAGSQDFAQENNDAIKELLKRRKEEINEKEKEKDA